MFIVYILHPQRSHLNCNCGLPTHCRISPPSYHRLFGRRNFLGAVSTDQRILWKAGQWKQDDLVMLHIETSKRQSQEFGGVNRSSV
jgi:hypothetical protein